MSPHNDHIKATRPLMRLGSALGSEPRISRPLVRGVYVPTVCFFEPGSEDVDVVTIAKHAVSLAQSGVAGLATQGSNGEAVHLTSSERRLVTSVTRDALDDHGYRHMPIIVGCGAQSTRETIQLCRDAYESGGDYALVLPPAYYAGLFNQTTVVDYFHTVADASPIPIIIYNFPGAVNGMDLSSSTIIQLAKHPKIVGVKLTCGNTGKMCRIVAATRSPKTANADVPEFIVLAGSADFAVQSLSVGAHGMLAGLANLAPKACIQVLELSRAGKTVDAAQLQEVLARGDWVAIQGGVVGVKAGMQMWCGRGGVCRSPLPQPTAVQTEEYRDGFRELMSLENTL